MDHETQNILRGIERLLWRIDGRLAQILPEQPEPVPVAKVRETPSPAPCGPPDRVFDDGAWLVAAAMRAGLPSAEVADWFASRRGRRQYAPDVRWLDDQWIATDGRVYLASVPWQQAGPLAWEVVLDDAHLHAEYTNTPTDEVDQ